MKKKRMLILKVLIYIMSQPILLWNGNDRPYRYMFLFCLLGRFN